MNIVIEYVGIEFYYAYFAGQKEKAQAGKSPSSAIGKLIHEEPQAFGITLTKMMRDLGGTLIESDNWPVHFH